MVGLPRHQLASLLLLSLLFHLFSQGILYFTIVQQINRMLYRARQRGWLELDLLVGMWAEREIERLTPAMLNDFEILLDQENPELYKWLTGQITPPESMLSNLAFQSIRGEVLAALEANGAPAAMAKDGAQWINAWQEYRKQLEDAGAKLGGESGTKSA